MVARTWNGSADNWNTPAGWTGGAVPDASDDVTIGSGSPQVTGPISANSIDNSGTLQFHNSGPGSEVGDSVVNGGELSLDAEDGEGGSTLTIGAALTNDGTVAIGNSTLSGATALSAASIANDGGRLSIIGSAAHQATVSLGSAAGLGADGIILGDVELTGNALLEFDRGTIYTIDAYASLRLDGALASVAIAGLAGTNSALTDLISNNGTFELANGAAVTIDGALENDGVISVSGDCGEGGSMLAIGGALDNYYNVLVGNCTLSGPATLSADSIYNEGLLSIIGNGANQATVSVDSAAGLGTSDGLLMGAVELIGNALLEFGGGGTIDTIGSGASLTLVGAQARVARSADPGSNSALTGLAFNDGALIMADGASVTTHHDPADGPEVPLDFVNEGIVSLDAFPGEGGSELKIEGAFINHLVVAVGNCGLSADTTLSAASFFNGGGLLITGGTTHQAAVRLASDAGLCATPGLLMGAVALSGNALLEFAAGSIDTIDVDASLSLDGAEARINAAAIDPSVKNSALTKLAFNHGVFQLTNGASVETVGVDLDNKGGILLDACGCEGDGSSLTIGGTLTNFDTVEIGNVDLSAATTLSADAFHNDELGLLSIIGGDIFQATVSLGSLAGLGAAGSLTGEVELIGNALLEFAGGTIDTIEVDASLLLLGAQARVAVTADLGSNSALVGLARNDGTLELANGAEVSTDPDLDFINTGDLYVDEVYGDGGSTLSIGGELSNFGTITVGNDGLSADTTLSAESLDNKVSLSIIGSPTHQATVNIASDADFYCTGTGFLDGIVRLRGNALLQFASGTIDTIGSAAALWLDGAQARVAVTGALDRNSALTGLAYNEGALDLTNGAEVTITGSLNNSGWLQVDGSGGDGGGSALAVGAALVNSNIISLGNGALSSSATMSANALVNLGSGLIDLYGNGASEGRLTAGSVANTGTITVHAGGALDITGDLGLDGNSLLTVESGGTLTTGALTTVLKGGDGTTSIIDLQGQSFESQYRIVVQSGALQFIGTAGTATPELTGAGIIQGEVALDGSNVLTITPTGQVVGTTNVYHFYHTDLGLAYTDVVAADGSMTITGSNRGEILTGGAFNDLIYAGNGDDTLNGEAGDDKLYGRAGIDALNGGEGNDRLDGGLGADVMKGGTGDDLYFVDDTGDEVWEIEGEGIDTVYTKVGYTLGVDDEIEILRANAGDTGLMLGGNRFDNRLVGRAGDDTLSGGEGDDRLYGYDGADTLDGGDGDDRLDGGLGADRMTGGAGNDVFYVDNPGDEVIEAVGGGSDTIYSSTDYTLALGEEIEGLRGNAGATGLMLGGNEFDNALYGRTGDDTLSGGEGDDRLYGGDGTDGLNGGDGNDQLNGGIGNDTLDGGASDDKLSGNDGDDTLDAGNGNDRLNGGAGADRMTGGSGNDVFYVDNPGDEVIEAGGGGTDAIYSSINYTLALGDEIESLRATARATGLTLGGNEFSNTVFGAAGDDWLSGGEGEDKLYGRDGDDTLAGGAGNDRLEGGAGADIFLFDTPFMSVTNVDTVADFEIGIDTIRLDSTFFTGLALGHLSASAFAIDAPTGTDPQIVYNSANGSLFFDRDGTGPEGTASFAKVAGAPLLTAGSFFVV